jgi:formylglycine-generating enzyme required for sulfatase activity
MMLRRCAKPAMFALALIALFVTLAAGCSRTHQTRGVNRSGFLKDYSQLKKGRGKQAQLIYINPKVNFTGYDKIMIDPITLWHVKDSRMAKVPPKDLRRLAAYLNSAIRKQLALEYVLVNQPGPGTLRLRVAITEAKGSKTTLDTLSNVLPPMVVISGAKRLVTGTHAFVGRAAVEAELLDSVSGVRLLAAVDARAGRKVWRGKFGTWNDAKDAYDYWGERIRIRLHELRLESALASGIGHKSLVNSVGIRLIRIKPGSFQMGADNDGQELGRGDEQPAHKVKLTKAFYLGATEVTQLQWSRVMGENPSRKDKGPYLAATEVNWKDCQEFCEKLTEEEYKAGRLPIGISYTLPTEAEWEYACRAGSTAKYCFGDDAGKLGDYAWYAANSRGRLQKVGLKKANAFGLYDVHGNVWEWCQDWKVAYGTEGQVDPRGPDEGTYRAGRGGAFGNKPGELRSVKRGGATPSFRSFNIGFRVALKPSSVVER